MQLLKNDITVLNNHVPLSRFCKKNVQLSSCKLVSILFSQDLTFIMNSGKALKSILKSLLHWFVLYLKLPQGKSSKQLHQHMNMTLNRKMPRKA